MPTPSKDQKGTVERVMHEFKEGELRIGGDGPKVKDRRQAIAIALREAGESNRESPARNKSTLKRTKAKEARGETAEAEAEGKRAQDHSIAKGANGGKEPGRKEPGGKAAGSKASGKKSSGGKASARGADGETRSALYAEAQRRDIPGRSRMSKDQLQKALGH